MFEKMMEKAVRENLFLSKAEFKPFAKINDRAQWESVTGEAKAYLKEMADQYRNRSFPILPARTYMRFLKDGNRSEFEGLYFDRRHALLALVLDECIRNKGENLSTIIDLIWAICEETTWVVSAHNRIERGGEENNILPDADGNIFIDLFSAETGSLLAWCVYLIEDRLNVETPIIVRRVKAELKKRLLKPYLAYSDYFWMGLANENPVNNWNPWINENILAVALTTEEDEETRNALLLKIGKSVQRFLHFYAPDGGCDEGPMYFNIAGGSYLDCLDLVYRATDGKASLYDRPLTQNMASYIMNVHIANQYYVNFADAAARLTPDGMLLLRAAERMKLPMLRDFAVSLLLDGDSEPYFRISYNVIHRRIANLLEFNPEKLEAVKRPLPMSHVFNGIEVAIARTENTTRGLCFAAKGGHNMESHNHNDIGNFVVYLNGEPVLCDIGVETYSRKTFSHERYTIFTMKSSYHNTAIINGFDQLPGYAYKAKNFSFKDDGMTAEYRADISPAYPEEAGVVAYNRSIILDRKSSLIKVEDAYRLKTAAGGVAIPLISLSEPEFLPGKIVLTLKNTKAVIEYDETMFTAGKEELDTSDKSLYNAWRKNVMYRTILSPISPSAEGTFSLTIKEA